jgi:hypothetical protein
MAWGRVDDTYYDHPKLDRVEAAHDAQMRLMAAGLNALAWSYCNRFLTDGFVATRAIAKLGGLPEVVVALVEAELWDHVAGGYQVHDFLDHNDSRETIMERREKEAKRKADWRRGRGKKASPAGTDGGTDDDGEHDVPPGHAPSDDVPTGQTAGQNGGRCHGGTRARASRSANPDPSRPVPTRPVPTRPVPTRPVPTENLSRENPRARPGERADITALHDRGWKRVSPKQRALLDEVAARHDTTGHAFAASVIEATAPDADPLAMVMQADAQWQDAQRRRAAAEEEAWASTKAEDREQANGAVDRVEAGIKAWTR